MTYISQNLVPQSSISSTTFEQMSLNDTQNYNDLIASPTQILAFKISSANLEIQSAISVWPDLSFTNFFFPFTGIYKFELYIGGPMAGYGVKFYIQDNINSTGFMWQEKPHNDVDGSQNTDTNPISGFCYRGYTAGYVTNINVIFGSSNFAAGALTNGTGHDQVVSYHTIQYVGNV